MAWQPPRYVVEDPNNLSGPPAYSWEGQGMYAWWQCRLCNNRAEETHITSAKHMKNYTDFVKYPENWHAHLRAFKTPAKVKPESPATTLEYQPPLALPAPVQARPPPPPCQDEWAQAKSKAPPPPPPPARFQEVAPPPGLGGGTTTTTLEDQVTMLQMEMAALRLEVQALRGDVSALAAAVNPQVNMASAADNRVMSSAASVAAAGEALAAWDGALSVAATSDSWIMPSSDGFPA